MARILLPQLACLMLLPFSAQGLARTLAFDFVDAAEDVGLRFEHDFGGARYIHIVEATGAGVCAFDADGDGDDDILLIDGGALEAGSTKRGGSRFYRNDDGTLTELTDQAGLAGKGHGMGCAVADVDGDADLDVFVTNYGPDELFLNDGRGVFREVAESAGLADPRWTTSAAFADADGDGDLDLAVAAYVVFDPENPKCVTARGVRTACTPHSYEAIPSRLYRNDGLLPSGAPVFVDVSETSGATDPDGKSLGVVFEDLTNDGLPDLYFANDTVRNTLLVNVGDLRFVDRTMAAGVGLSDAGAVEEGMGIAVGDLNGSGLMDLVVTNFQAESNTVYQGRRRGKTGIRWRDVTDSSGLGRPSFVPLGFGVNLGDFDLDGDLDLYVANGHVDDRVEEHDPVGTHAQSDQLFVNESRDGRIRFKELAASGLKASHRVGRGSAWLDLEGDGDVDLVVNNNGGRAQLLKNRSAREDRRWLGVSLSSPGPNTFGVGALVAVEARVGDETRVQRRRIRTASSFLSSSPPRAHFGLAAATSARVTVHWPDGLVQEVGKLSLDAWHVVRRAGASPDVSGMGGAP